MMFSFVILEIYFFIILIADVLFIYLICTWEPEHRKLYNRGSLFVGWFGGLLRVTRDSSVFWVLSEWVTWAEAVPAFTQGMLFRNLYILQLPEQ